MMMTMAQHNALNQDENQKLEAIRLLLQDSRHRTDALDSNMNRLEATETEKSENFDRELEEGDEDDDSEKRRERR